MGRLLDPRVLLLTDGSVGGVRSWRELSEGDYDVLVATTLKESLDFLSAYDVDAIVLYGDHETRQRALVERFVRTHLRPAVIVVTAVRDHAYHREMLDLGADECLRNDALAEGELVRRVRGAIELRQARRRIGALAHELRSHNRELSGLRRVTEQERAGHGCSPEVRARLATIVTLARALSHGFRGPLQQEQGEVIHQIEQAAERALLVMTGDEAPPQDARTVRPAGAERG